MDKLEKVIDLVKNSYKVNHCSYTPERSFGNADDVFEDGTQCGKAWLLYELGQILELGLEEPEEDEDDYDWT